MHMTYRQLLAELKDLTEEQLDQTVTIYNISNDECVGVIGSDVTGEESEDDVRPELAVFNLDDGHYYLAVEE